ncbi:MAG: SurA N-terminal domain-containing protein [Rhodospirillales bacterium]|nr:SurA N-terminal domain-containing protein [Rhodospirillales bacterium]
MLELLHNASKTFVVKILLALLIVSFGAWGVGDVFKRVTSDNIAVEVGPESIPVQELAKDFEREVKRLRPLFGGKLSNEQAREFGLLDRTLDQIVARTLYQLEANRLGLSVGEAELQRTIFGIAAFQGENGKFDKSLYQMTLSNNNMSEADFLKLLKGDIVRSQLLAGVGGSVAVPGLLIQQVLAYRQEKRVADMLIAEAGAMPPPQAPSESELADFHKANAARFTAPETRNLLVLHVTQDSLAEESKPSDADVEETYRVRIDEFSSPEKRIVLQMLFDSQDKAKAASARLDKGEAFAKVAKEEANMDDQATLLGRIERRDLPADLSGLVFSLPVEGATPPLKTPLGWHILKVTAITASAPKPLNEVKAQIAKELALENAAKALNTLSAQIVDEVAGGAHLEEAAKKYNIKLHSFGPLDAKGREPSGAAVKKLPVPEKLLELAFATPEGADSSIIELDDGILGVRVVKVTPAALKALSEVRDQVKTHWAETQKRKTALERAEKALERLKAGAGFATVAQELGLKVKATAPFLRDAPMSEHGLPPRLVAEMFKAKPGDAAMAQTQDGAMVARLGKIVSADPKDSADVRIEIAQALEQGLSADMIDQFTSALAQRYGVKKHEKAVNSYFRQP